MEEFRTPYLIQRCKRKPGSTLQSGQKFSDVLELDYMGSAEFEFGSVPKCLREMHGQMPLVVADVQVNGKTVYIVCREDLVAPYVGWMNDVVAVKKSEPIDSTALWRIRLKEHINFWKVVGAEEDSFLKTHKCRKKGCYHPKPEELWLDIINCVAFTLDLELAGIFANLLTGSIKYMDSKKEVA